MSDSDGMNSSFEGSLNHLKEIVERLERGDVELEEAVALYKRGLASAKDCRTRLAKARHEVEVYQDGLLSEFSWEAEGGATAEGERERDDD